MSTNAEWFISPYFDHALFSLPPSPEPLTVVPPPQTISIMHPFNISARVYRTALDPRVPISLAIVYVTVIENLNRYNTSRGGQPWKISGSRLFTMAIFLHNIGLALYSAWSFYGLLTTIQNSFVSPFVPNGLSATLDSLCRMHGPPGLGQSHFFNSNTSQWETANASLRNSSNMTLPDPMARGRIWNEGLGYYGWIFYLSKFYEVIDTLVILAKGKRASKLQVYHHAGAMICVWAGIRYMSAPIWLFVMINSFIHSVMYSYYALTSISVPVPVFVKRLLTTMQIIQLLLGISYSSVHMFLRNQRVLNGLKNASQKVVGKTTQHHPCLTTANEAFAIYINVLYLVPLTYLFAQFFILNYIKRRTP